MLIGSDFEVLSEYPLWTYGEDNSPVLVQNIYDNIEVIRYWPHGKEYQNKYFDIPIEDPITFFAPFGTFFFKKQEECARYGKFIESEEGKMTVLENSYGSSRRNKHIVKMKCDKEDFDKIQNGLYSISEFDNILDELSELDKKLLYIDEEHEINKIQQADDILRKYIRDYLKMFSFEERHDFINERLIFEVYKEKRFLYINHIFMKDSCMLTPQSIILCSRINNYPICYGSSRANEIKTTLEKGGHIGMLISYGQNMLCTAKRNKNRKERNKKLVRTIATECGEFAWKYKKEILSFIKGIATAATAV